MELLQLRYFRTAAQLENFSKAAEQHMIPQSAISKTIRKLEEELGCELFHRQGKRISLNENGKQFLARVDAALENLDTGITELQPKQLQMIRVYVQSGIRFVPELVSSFEKKFSDIKIISYQGEPVEILGEEYDFTLFQLPIDEAFFHYELLMEDELMLAVPNNSKYARKKTLPLSALSDENFITFCKGNQLRSYFDDLCHSEGFEPHIIFEAKEASVFRSMIEANTGLALVPFASWHTSKSEHVTLIPLTTHPKRSLVLAWKKTTVLSPAEEIFLNFSKNWFAQF